MGDVTDPLWKAYSGQRQKFLGKGSYGEVVLAQHRATGNFHALKFADVSVEGWEREPKVLKSLSHPNVLKLLEVFLPWPPSRRSVVLASPAADTDLGEFLRRRGISALDEITGCFLSREVGRGIEYLHSRDIVHRDIKPANILVTFVSVRSLQWEVVVSDFGFARPVVKQSHMTPRVVTLWYRAPEIIITPKVAYGKPVDVWSWGCLMYEVLKGEPLAPGVDESEYLEEVVKIMGREGLDLMLNTTTARWKKALGHVQLVGGGLAQSLAGRSTEAVECIQSIFQWDPSTRPTAADALKCKWWAMVDGSVADAPQHHASVGDGQRRGREPVWLP